MIFKQNSGVSARDARDLEEERKGEHSDANIVSALTRKAEQYAQLSGSEGLVWGSKLSAVCAVEGSHEEEGEGERGLVDFEYKQLYQNHEEEAPEHCDAPV